MKNFLYILGLFSVISLLFSSCEKRTKYTDTIGFQTDVETKAMIGNVSDIQNDANGLSVYGVRVDASSQTSLVFDNSQLKYESSAWSYGSVKYWIPDNTYYFVSIYPYSASDYTFSTSSKSASFNYESSLPADLNNQKDILYAYHSRSFVSGG